MKHPVLCTLFALTIAASASAQTCSTSSYGTSCGPVLAAVATPNGNTYRVALKVSKAEPRSVLVMLIGAKRIDLQLSLILPGAAVNCRLLTDLVFLQYHEASAAGTYTYARALPSTAVGTGHAQFIEIRGNGKVFATNGVTVVCK